LGCGAVQVSRWIPNVLREQLRLSSGWKNKQRQATIALQVLVSELIAHIKKIQQDAKMYHNLFRVYTKLNVFRAT